MKQGAAMSLPNGWKIKQLGDIAKFSQGIQVGLKEQLTNPAKGYVRFIRIVDYTQNTNDTRYVKDPGEKYYVNTNDVVMVRYGTPGLVGRGIEGVIANNLFRITINNEKICNDYLSLYLSQSDVQSYLGNQGSSTMPAITFGHLNKVIVKYPPLAEQKRIVSKLDELNSQTQSLESNYRQELNALDELKKSILQKAFMGEL
jgi:type I restriction enzyme S subunit